MEDQRKIHLINRETLTRCKEQGGLWIRSKRNQNIALMAKLGWRLLYKTPHSMWAQLLPCKYIRGNLHISEIKKKNKAFNAWHGILVAIPLMRRAMKHRVYNSKKILFWQDPWIEEAPLITSAMKEVSMEDSLKPVAAYWDTIAS